VSYCHCHFPNSAKFDATPVDFLSSAHWFLIVLEFPRRIFGFLYWRLYDMRNSANRNLVSQFEQRKTIPTFYSYIPSEADYISIILLSHTVTSMVGGIFGAIHCFGWSFNFPSHVESILWRVAASLITGFPVLMLVHLGFYLFTNHFSVWKSWSPLGIKIKDSIRHLIKYTFRISAPVYLLARIALLVEALLGLRNLPPGAYSVVEWSSVLPHVS